MYICKVCRRYFEGEEVIQRVYRDGDTMYEGLEYLCPFCLSEEIMEVE